MNDFAIPEDDGIQTADIKAIRAEGPTELRSLMRAQIAIGRSRRDSSPATPKPPPPTARRPGAWPAGSSPPGRPPEWDYPPELWAAAVRHYRNEEYRPGLPCDCGQCTTNATKETS
ncbi:hypothetical protein [Streptomyces sp. NPDC004376]